MNRASWYLRRHAERASDPRKGRGLPHHPDGSGLAQCPRCNGNGVIDRAHHQPELCTSATCSLCDGSGYIADGYRDPLLRLRYARQRRLRDPQAYAHLRKVCAASRHALRLIEACVGAELAARGAVQAFRSAA